MRTLLGRAGYMAGGAIVALALTAGAYVLGDRTFAQPVTVGSPVKALAAPANATPSERLYPDRTKPTHPHLRDGSGSPRADASPSSNAGHEGGGPSPETTATHEGTSSGNDGSTPEPTETEAPDRGPNHPGDDGHDTSDTSDRSGSDGSGGSSGSDGSGSGSSGDD